MTHRLIVKKDWRYRDRALGATTLAAGTYDVPRQVAKDVAELAVAQGMASLEAVTKADNPPPPPDRSRQDAPRNKRRQARRKGPAPENEALGRAPENKFALV